MSLDKSGKIVLKWKYTPPDFFRAPFSRKNDNYEMEIDNGHIIATTSGFYNSDKNVRIMIHEDINDLFLGAQTFTFKHFKLSKPTISHSGQNGRQNITLFLSPLVSHCVISDEVDLILKDENGNIIEDSKAERIKTERHFAELAAKYNRTDKTARSILNSYNKAVNDPSNEFIYLYEIRDSLCQNFHNEKGLRDALGISKRKLDRLRILANVEPLLQGRHRGKNIGTLRDATNEEKNEARIIARQLVHSYLEFIDSKYLVAKGQSE